MSDNWVEFSAKYQEPVFEDEEGSLMWTVEKIISRKIKMEKNKRKAYYLVKWEGWPSKYNTWEPIENLESCKSLVSNYDKKNNNLKSNLTTTDYKRIRKESKESQSHKSEKSIKSNKASKMPQHSNFKKYENSKFEEEENLNIQCNDEVLFEEKKNIINPCNDMKFKEIENAHQSQIKEIDQNLSNPEIINI